MRLLFAVVVATLMPSAVLAQDVAPVNSLLPFEHERRRSHDMSPLDDLVAIVHPETTLTQRIILVIDVSGSMKSEGRISRALQVVQHIMENPTDDLEVAVVTFNTIAERWPGIPEPDARDPVPPGWARLPSADALLSAQAFVESRYAGGTDPVEAITLAISEPRDDVSVVFITDGVFDGQACVAAVRLAQGLRLVSGRQPAPVLVYGVGSGAEKRPHMEVIGREGGGGFWVDKKPVKIWR